MLPNPTWKPDERSSTNFAPHHTRMFHIGQNNVFLFGRVLLQADVVVIWILDFGDDTSSTRANRPRDEGLCQSVRGFDRHFWHDTRSKRKDGSFFPNAPGGHLTTVAKQFEKARKEAGLPNDLVLYCARHGSGTEMYRATKNLFAVMNVMGHRNVSTTMKYQHQNMDEVAEVASHRVQ